MSKTPSNELKQILDETEQRYFVLAGRGYDHKRELALVNALRRAMEAVKRQPHHPRCHMLASRPFSEKAREVFDAKGCDCWKAQTENELTAILNQGRGNNQQ